MTAETIARALGGRKAGQGWMARCPAHDDREPSLSIREADGKVLVRCHAGCEQRDVIAALKKRGLWCGKATSPIHQLSRRRVPESRTKQQDEERSAVALAIWQSTTLLFYWKKLPAPQTVTWTVRRQRETGEHGFGKKVQKSKRKRQRKQ